MSLRILLNIYELNDFFCVKKRVFNTFFVIFPCNLFGPNVKFSVIFQSSCPCNITPPLLKRPMDTGQFAERQLAERQFAERQFAERQFAEN